MTSISSSHVLGVHALTPAEAGLARAHVLLLAAGHPNFRWTFATDGPCDALLAQAGSTPDRSRARTGAIAFLGDGPGDARLLQRPLQRDALLAWLEQVERQLERAAAPASAAAVADSEAALPRWRLRRWPPQMLIREDASRVRMATLLSRRALNVAELQALSGARPEEVRVFIQLMQSVSLLQVESAGTPHTASGARATAPAASATASVAALVRNIRRRFGLLQRNA
jgi:hypothetical protein